MDGVGCPKGPVRHRYSPYSTSREVPVHFVHFAVHFAEAAQGDVRMEGEVCRQEPDRLGSILVGGRIVR